MRLLALAVMAVLAGCGFHLRGTASVPFETLYIPNAKTGIALDLKRNIEAGTAAKVVDDPKVADAVLDLSGETREKIILSLTGTGRVRTGPTGSRSCTRAAIAGDVGLNSTASRAAPGTTSLSSCSRLALSSVAIFEMPVRLPPG